MRRPPRIEKSVTKIGPPIVHRPRMSQTLLDAEPRRPLSQARILDRRRRHVHRLLRRRPDGTLRAAQAAQLRRDQGGGRRGLDRASESSIRPGGTIRPSSGTATAATARMPTGRRLAERARSPRFDRADRHARAGRAAARSRRRPARRYELAAGEEAPIVAIRYLLGLPLDEPIPPVAVRLGTTRGTNALLTRRGATHGAGHHARLRRHAADRLSEPAAAVRAGDPQAARRCSPTVVEIDERIDADGEVLRAPDADAGPRATRRAASRGHRIAGHLPAARLSSSRRTRLLVERIAREVGFDEISVSQPRRAADQDRLARRHDGRRCLSESRSCGDYVGQLRAALGRRPNCG